MEQRLSKLVVEVPLDLSIRLPLARSKKQQSSISAGEENNSHY